VETRERRGEVEQATRQANVREARGQKKKKKKINEFFLELTGTRLSKLETSLTFYTV
jgi:hypothetical protein